MRYSEYSPETQLGPWSSLSKAVAYTGVVITTLPIVEHIALSANYVIQELSENPTDGTTIQLPHSSYDDYIEQAVTDPRWLVVGAAITTLGIGMGMVGTRWRARRDHSE